MAVHGRIHILDCCVSDSSQIRMDRTNQSSSRNEPELLSDHGADAVGSSGSVACAGWHFDVDVGGSSSEKRVLNS
jgi:hypothetical protein